MRFVNLRYPYRPPRISFNATVNFAANNKKEFGETLIVSVRPQTGDIAPFEELECILNDDESNPLFKFFADQVKFPGTYEYAPCMDTNLNLNLKLRKNEDDEWKFETKLGDESDIKSKLFKGVQVDVEVTPGFYFNDTTQKFGMYYTVKRIDIAEEVVTKKRK